VRPRWTTVPSGHRLTSWGAGRHRQARDLRGEVNHGPFSLGAFLGVPGREQRRRLPGLAATPTMTLKASSARHHEMADPSARGAAPGGSALRPGDGHPRHPGLIPGGGGDDQRRVRPVPLGLHRPPVGARSALNARGQVPRPAPEFRGKGRKGRVQAPAWTRCMGQRLRLTRVSSQTGLSVSRTWPSEPKTR
jgi:hypothetical protein